MARLAPLPAVARAAAENDDVVAAALCGVEPRVHVLTASALITAGELAAAWELLSMSAPSAADETTRLEVCEQLLRLADTCTQRGRPDAAEDALRVAARVRPGAATAALARHLQRHGAVG
jgi:hypothetical protein